jgi:hypothetical protein
MARLTAIRAMHDHFQAAGQCDRGSEAHGMPFQPENSDRGPPAAVRDKPRTTLSLQDVNFIRRHSRLLSNAMSHGAKDDQSQENKGANRDGRMQNMMGTDNPSRPHEPRFHGMCQVVRHDRFLPKA